MMTETVQNDYDQASFKEKHGHYGHLMSPVFSTALLSFGMATSTDLCSSDLITATTPAMWRTAGTYRYSCQKGNNRNAAFILP
jgi:hypothetical protein